jgi:uncharacterized membrane protein
MILLPFHVTAGVLAIVTGFVALYVLKGGTLHRRSGRIFVYAILVMSLTGAVMSFGRAGKAGNIPVALLTAYLVITSLTAIRPRSGSSRMERAAMIRSHLWRMCAALFVATGSFFLGPVRRIPEPLRNPAFRLIPLVVLLTMAYWLWRYRSKRIARSAVGVPAPEAI